MSTLLTIDGVCQRFGASTALDHISLAVQQGEFIALLGPSGCGKTTLLRTIAGFLTPTTGRILIEDQDISRLPPHRRPLNTVFQNYALFPHMTVLENVMYGPRRKGVARAQAREQGNDALDMVGLAAFGLRYPRELSGGQQQRVALARAIVNRPKLLLLDEPLSALDLKLRKRVQLELKHLQQKLGIAFLFVTHDQEEAMTMADRIVVMHDGRVEQVGTGADIYRRPATRFVAEFIGQANILAHHNGIAVVRPEDVRVTLAQSDEPGRQPAQQETIQVPAVITDLVSVGSHTMVHAQAGEQQMLASLPGLPPERLASGQAVELSWSVHAMHLIAEPA